jgi:tetratricopeptide (TPR) repeat protein
VVTSRASRGKSNADKFQDYFYESLTQKVSKTMIRPLCLTAMLKLEPQNAVVYFELGKNYLASKDYPNAFSSFQRQAKSTLQTNGFS